MNEQIESPEYNSVGEIDWPIIINRTSNGYLVIEDREKSSIKTNKDQINNLFCFESLEALVEWLPVHFPPEPDVLAEEEGKGEPK